MILMRQVSFTLSERTLAMARTRRERRRAFDAIAILGPPRSGDGGGGAMAGGQPDDCCVGGSCYRLPAAQDRNRYLKS